MAHIGQHHIAAERAHHATQLVHALLVRRHLGAQVSHVLVDVARGIAPRGQQRARVGIAQRAARDQLPVVDQHALLLDVTRVGGHGARRGAADVRMVAARAHIEQRLRTALMEDRCNDGHVRQMGTAMVRIVEHEDIAVTHLAAITFDHGPNTLAHRAEMYRHVRGIGNEIAVAVKDRAGEIEPLLDVHGVRRVLQTQAHLLRDRHEQVVEDLEAHRIDGCIERTPRGTRKHPREHQVALRSHLAAPSRLDHRGSALFRHDRGTVERIPGE